MTNADALRIARANASIYRPMRGITDPVRTLEQAERDLAEQRAKEANATNKETK